MQKSASTGSVWRSPSTSPFRAASVAGAAPRSLWGRIPLLVRLLAALVVIHLLAVMATSVHSHLQGGGIVLFPLVHIWQSWHLQGPAQPPAAQQAEQDVKEPEQSRKAEDLKANDQPAAAEQSEGEVARKAEADRLYGQDGQAGEKGQQRSRNSKQAHGLKPEQAESLRKKALDLAAKRRAIEAAQAQHPRIKLPGRDKPLLANPIPLPILPKQLSEQDKEDIRKEEEAAAAEAKAAVEERRRRMEEARRKRAADSAAAAVLRSEMFEDARIAAEADQQEAKLNLLEQLRTRRAEVERIMAQRQAERDGGVEDRKLEEAQKKVDLAEKRVERADVERLRREKPQENVKRAFSGGQNGRIETEPPAHTSFFQGIFNRRTEAQRNDKSWLDRAADAILDKLELRWEDDEEARMDEEAEEAGEAGGNVTEAHGKAAVNNMRLDAGRVEDPDTQEDRRPAYSPFRQWPPDRCATALSIPKVAMMFLVRGDLHHSETWRMWFAFARDLVPLAAVKALPGCDSARLEKARIACANTSSGRAGDELSEQHLFNTYVHVGLNNDEFTGYPEDSIWFERDIIERVHVEWGRHSLVDATKNLMRIALREPLNRKFVLLSESGIPLYPPTTLYHQLMSEDLSRINSCTQPGWERHQHRWTDKMATPNMKKTHWRKSSQWFALGREHVEMVVADTEVNEAFSKFCYPTTEEGWWRDCFSDEHYFATLLAVLGRENETDCKGFMMHVDWSRGGAHPRSYEPREISAARLRLLRMPTSNCGYPSAIKSSAAQFVTAAELSAERCQEEVPEYSNTLGPQCPLFARKFPPQTANNIASLIRECKNRLKIVHGNECQRRLALLRKYS